MGSNLVFQNSKESKPNAVASGLIAYDSGDFGGGFASYVPPPPPPHDFDIRVVEDTNSTTPGKRLYIFVGGKWHYINMDG